MKKEGNREFFSRVLEEVKKLPVSRILEKYTKVKPNRFTDADGLCPFHGDREFGNFKISDRKGIYKCFSCGAYGDGIQFVEDLFQIGFQPAVLKIAVDQGIISEKQAEEYIGGKIFDMDVRSVFPSQNEGGKIDGITEIAGPYTLDVGYRLFLEGVTLSPEHRRYLRNRGISNEEIVKSGFFTFPEPTREFLDGLHERCRKYGITPNVFKRIPGFYTHPEWALDTIHSATGDREYRYTFARYQGIGIPIRNPMGYIVGIQIRKDTVTGKRKRYTWFSSSFAGDAENPFIFGTAAGTPIHVAFPGKNLYPNVVFITEGFFKAEAVAKTFGVVCLSVSGVGNYKNINEELKVLQFKAGTPLEHIYVAYDADMAENPQVFHHAKNMAALIREEFPDVKIHLAVWDAKDGKGIDDLIQNGMVHTLRRVEFDRFTELYDRILERLLEKYSYIQKIPKEEVREHYFRYVFPHLSELTAG
ncbi:DNA primase (bacterial type) [Caldibacillus debilis GB1]|uniref:DNA primase (Bacterial type) n=1 Tax=Caldibacillus debilis GB1 TaxID=1339248 RepID=A0A420VDW8_9BACI|nr:DNA primase (bacterial type) [Caldibacillus debilis GB1]